MSNNAQGIPLVYVDVVQYLEDNIFVAECLELPIVVEAETFEKVTERMNLAIKGFLETFPNESKKALSETKIKVQLTSQPEVKEKTILKLPIPLIA
jgi:predicted RNase H-like HicB family nuclease